METVFLFDVDGTLTPPRETMNLGFARFFRDFVASHPVYLISGSDFAKIAEQVDEDILLACSGVFGSSGAEFKIGDELVYRKHHDFHPAIREACRNYVDTSTYPWRFGNHIEERPGMLNVSAVGRFASLSERKKYHAWDGDAGERKVFADAINASGLGYEASAGGEISIDIVPAGWNKAVVKAEVMRRHPGAALAFYGDSMAEGGNDRPLALALEEAGAPHRAIAVHSWTDTWRELMRQVRHEHKLAGAA